MTKTKLTPGMPYRSTKEIANPEPDRRKTLDWRRTPTIPAGIRFVLYDGRKGLVLLNIDDKWPWANSVEEGSDLFDLIAPTLAPIPETLDSVMFVAGYGNGYERVLEHLVKTGKVTLEDVRAACAALDKEG